jgi:1,4-alpha-glucan branching enzyme
VALGYLSFLLHAHLPFVNHGEDPRPRRDDWLVEALVESYIPLLLSWHHLVEERVQFRLTLSVSPTLIGMLRDPLVQERSRGHLRSLLELAEKEVDRTQKWPDIRALAEMYRQRIAEAQDFFTEQCGSNLVQCIHSLAQTGSVEVITTAATHGFLPALKAGENAVRSQVMVALDSYAEVFGNRPRGFWLPECGYYPGLDGALEAEGIRYFIVDSGGLLKARPRPKYGFHAPVYMRSGVAAFARDPAASEQVWSSIIGYPGDHNYREFYRDIGHDLDYGYLAPYLPADGSRKDTGFKYYRITGPGNQKQIYVREHALSKAGLHSGHFLEVCKQRIGDLSHQLERRPIIVAPFDAELFGHWWFEGPEWLEYLIRKVAFDQSIVALTTPSEYLDRYPVNQVVELCPSTWGREGFNKVWVNGANDYIYRHLHRAARQMKTLAAEASKRRRLAYRAAQQAARELLLAQSSDWPFMMCDSNTADYGHMRFRKHMLNFLGLHRQIRSGRIERDWLNHLENADNLFPNIKLAHFSG